MTRIRKMKPVGMMLLAAACLPNLRAEKGATDLLADQADAIVAAEVSLGQQTGRSLAFDLLISRTVKGDLVPGSTVSVTGGNGVSAAISVNRKLSGQFGLWFLKRTGGHWEFLPVIQGGATLETSGYVPLLKTTSPAGIATVVSPTTVSDRMAVELVATLQSYTDSKQLNPVAQQLYGIVDSTVLPALYGNLRSSSDIQLKFIGLTGLLGGPDEVSALTEIASNVDMITKIRTASLVGVAISGTRNPDPRTIPSLGKIASSPEPIVQRWAAMALENIHSRDALPFLAQLLDSPDAMARESAMSGLSRFVDNLPIQTVHNILTGKGVLSQGPTPYRTPETDKYSLSRRQLGSADESSYLSFWRSWWATMKNQLAP
jgi:hypothetical protein